MKKVIRWTGILLTFVCVVSCMDIYRDRQFLHDSLIRLHVVGASDSDIDQNVKLQVRDAVIMWLGENMEYISSAEEAREYLDANLDELEMVANEALAQAGAVDSACVSLSEEAFPTRDYDTFSLPAGVYHSLRIQIGEANGRNWWCVVFPSLCLGATTEAFEDSAVSAGFDEDLAGTLGGDQEYKIRFFILDCLGLIENFFYGR